MSEEPEGWLGRSYTPARPRNRSRADESSPPPARSSTQSSSAKRQPSSKRSIDILSLMDSPQLFGNWFRPRSSWFPWRVLLAAAFGLPIERTGDPEAALKLFTECTARTKWPTEQSSTLCAIIGARGGKSRSAALISTYLCCLRDYSRSLAPGERGVLPVIAADRKQARVVFNYASSFVTGSDLFRELLEDEGELKERLVFSTGIDLEIMTASFRATRGYTAIGGVLDEVAVYRSDEYAAPDVELLNAVRRGTLTIPNAMLVLISSPYGRRGVLYDTYRAHWGVENSSTLVWKSPTWVMNPTISKDDLSEEFERDPDKANADYGAEFRKDVERFVSIEVINACTDLDRHDLPHRTDTEYFAFADPSGGSQDSFTLAIGHVEAEADSDLLVVDALYEWAAPFSPDSIVEEATGHLKDYNLQEVTGDKYAGEWPSERFAAHGIVYDVSTKSKSDLYRDLLPLMNSHRVQLPDLPRLKAQLWNLERRTTGSGKDTIDHPPGGHDDLANVIAGVVERMKNVGKFRLTF